MQDLDVNYTPVETVDEDMPYYQQFEKWYAEMSGLCPNCSYIRWDPRLHKFYAYQAKRGFYEEFYEENVLQIFGLFADQYKVDLKPQNYTVFMKRFKSWACILFTKEWNEEGYENLEEGVLNLSTLELEPHSPMYMFRYVVPRRFTSPNPLGVQLFENLLKTGDKPALLRQYLINMVHRDFTDKKFLIVYGKAGGGKSTLLNIPANMFGDELTSTTDLYRLGKKFGLKDCYKARINIDSDIPVKTMDANVVSILKKLTGGVHGSDNKVTVELKGVDLFSVRIGCYFVFGCNQLPKWDTESLTECESIGRRALLVHYETFQIDCAGLEEITLDADFLDDIYSYLIRLPVKPINMVGKEQWIKQALDEWFTDCDPLLGILKDLYEPTDKDMDSVLCTEVYEMVCEELNKDNSTIPKNLMAQITQSLMTLGIRKNSTKTKPKYLKIARKYDPDTKEVYQKTLDGGH